MTDAGQADDGTTDPVTPRRGRPALKAAALVGVAVVVLGGLALVITSRDEGERANAADGACVPVVMVVRHAEDANTPPPESTPYLTVGGKLHASLYPQMFESYLSAAHSIGAGGVDALPCPVGRVIAINPNPTTVAPGPSTNPYNTILPYATAAKLPIEVVDPSGVPYTSAYVWNTARRQALLKGGAAATTSTVVAWDKAGLNPTADEAKELAKYIPSATSYTADDGLLKKLPTTFTFEANGQHYTPPRNHFFVFAQQDPTTGKFAIAKRYEQQYSKDGTNWYVQPILPDTDNPTSLRVGPKV